MKLQRRLQGIGKDSEIAAGYSESIVSGEVVGYAASPGAPYSQADAEIVGEELRRIGDGGIIATEQVLSSARLSSSPLHRFFTWDDQRAAHLHRQGEARDLVNHLEVVVKTPSGVEVRSKAYYSCIIPVQEIGQPADPDEDGEDEDEDGEGRASTARFYVPVRTAIEREDTREQLFRQALRDLQGWRFRYAAIGDERLQPLLDAINILATA